MSYNGHSGSLWIRVGQHFALDAVLVIIGFYAATLIRLTEHSYFFVSIPGMIFGVLAFTSIAYILGLYTFEGREGPFLNRIFCLCGAVVGAFIMMAIFFYATLAFQVGRGTMAIGWLFSFLLLVPHHFLLHRQFRRHREQIAFVLFDSDDEEELNFLEQLEIDRVVLAGVIVCRNYVPKGSYRIIGSLEDLEKTLGKEKIDLLVCAGEKIWDEGAQTAFRKVRYAGYRILPTVSFCEEVYKYVPLRLVSSQWLYHASIFPHSFYIRKIKRAFDICGALAGLFFSSPVFLLGMLAVRLTSEGPLFYRQVRVGRRGELFEVLKLRTMHVDAEKDGVKWAAGHSDPRLTPVGGFLRKYRIDELPQFINVLRGEMSFVGPRPERPEFIELISQSIPLFCERLMVPPGITGWAQVRYPYGASIADAAHKLEYDFYYMKYMNVFLDILILLDTVRTIVSGGLGAKDMERRRWLKVSSQFFQKGILSPEGVGLNVTKEAEYS